jgi:hypothetical protein
MNNVPQSAEINYLAESIYDEEIMIRTSAMNENDIAYDHSVYRTGDKKELCRIRIRWKEERIK